MSLAFELHDSDGRREDARSDVLGCTFATFEEGSTVRVTWAGGEAVVARGEPVADRVRI